MDFGDVHVLKGNVALESLDLDERSGHVELRDAHVLDLSRFFHDVVALVVDQMDRELGLELS